MIERFRIEITFSVLTLTFAAISFSLPSSRASADTYFVQPVLELDANGKVESFQVLKGSGGLSADGLARISAGSESEACNRAVDLIGTFTSQPIEAKVCRGPQSNLRCDTEFFHSAKIVGGAILKTQGGDDRKMLVSHVNELKNPGVPSTRLCNVTVSWDPANRQHREFAYENYWWNNQGQFQKVYAGQKNPAFRALTQDSGSTSK